MSDYETLKAMLDRAKWHLKRVLIRTYNSKVFSSTIPAKVQDVCDKIDMTLLKAIRKLGCNGKHQEITYRPGPGLLSPFVKECARCGLHLGFVANPKAPLMVTENLR